MKTKTLTRAYLVMNILEEPFFFGPVLLIALAKLAHMTGEQIFLSEAFATGLIIILDAPSGVLADMMGRKRCVILGKIIFLASVCCIALMNSPALGYIANILWAISISLRSGAESALLYDELAKRKALDTYPALMKKCYSYHFILAAGATLLSGFAAEISLRLPLLLSIPGVLISTILIFFFPKEDIVIRTHTWKKYREHTLEALHELWRNTYLRKLLVWLGLLGVVGKIYFFTYNPYLELVHMPYSSVGIIFFAINITSFIASHYAFVLHKRMDKVGVWIGFIFQGATMLVQAYVARSFCGWLFTLQGFTRGYISTISEPILNKEILAEKRATMLSFQSSFSNFLSATAFVIASPLSNNPLMLMAILGTFSLLLGFFSRKL